MYLYKKFKVQLTHQLIAIHLSKMTKRMELEILNSVSSNTLDVQ